MATINFEHETDNSTKVNFSQPHPQAHHFAHKFMQCEYDHMQCKHDKKKDGMPSHQARRLLIVDEEWW